MLKATMDDMNLDYVEAEGEAAFYGPKLDIQVKTALGNEETLSTIQLDFLNPENFDISDDRKIAGFAVCDEVQGFLGRVVRIEENPAHPLLVVMREEDASSIQGQSFEDQTNLQDTDNNNAAYTEVLIPLVDAFVVDIDENACVIKVSLPDGLLDL